MSEVIHTFAVEHLYRFAFIVSLCMAAMLVAMVVDLIFGVRKAKRNGEATTSTGLKKTCDKARKYFSPFMTTVCIDIIAACANLQVPIFSMLWAAYCVFCEFISIREKAWQKAEIRKQERTMKVILENKGDIAKTLIQLLNQEQKEGGEKDENN
ncbi:MAG: phage holin family protein [Segatella copri]|nr:phage holin family protein [Segatella copri]